MPASPNGDKPTVDLNLDTLEREGAPTPFAFVLGGKRFVCIDPADIDYRVFMEVDEDDTTAQFRLLLEDSYDEFAEHELALWKLQRLMKDVQEHYGLGEDVASLR